MKQRLPVYLDKLNCFEFGKAFVRLLLVQFFLETPSQVSAQCDFHENAQLEFNEASDGDLFGESVAIGGETTVVGAPGNECAAGRCGSVFVYLFSEDGPVLEAKLGASNAAHGDGFGSSVAIDQDTIVVGSPGGRAIYVFTKPEAGWTNMTETAKLTASDGSNCAFGRSVSISGDTIVAGRRGVDCSPQNQNGEVFVFVKPQTGWSDLTETTRLMASEASPYFASSVDIDNDTIVARGGATYVYVRPENGWDDMTPTAELIASDGASLEGQVAIDSNTVLVGSLSGVEPVYLFVRPTDGWVTVSETAKLTPGAAGSSGRTVALNNDTAVVGVNKFKLQGYSSAYVFFKPLNGWTDHVSYTQLRKSDRNAVDLDVPSVAIADGTIILGVPQACSCSPSESCGGAYTFEVPQWLRAEENGIKKSKFISFSVPCIAYSALRITLESLHHVLPPYTGGPSIPFEAFEGQIRWVGRPEQYTESSSNPIVFHASELQCSPRYWNWSQYPVIHVTGSAIVPSSRYRVENIGVTCLGHEDNCNVVSEPLFIETGRWADIELFQNPPSLTTQPDLGDVSALVNKFRNAPSAPIKARALLVGGDSVGTIDIATEFSFIHIAACVDAFKGKPYPYEIAACP